MPPHLAILLQAVPAPESEWERLWNVLKTLAPWAISIALFYLNRRGAALDKAAGKKEADEERARAERLETLRKQESRIAQLEAARETFAKQIEAIGNQQATNTQKVDDIDKRATKNEARLDSLKDSLGHIEGGVSEVRNMIFNARSHDRPT